MGTNERVAFCNLSEQKLRIPPFEPNDEYLVPGAATRYHNDDIVFHEELHHAEIRCIQNGAISGAISLFRDAISGYFGYFGTVHSNTIL